MCLSRCVSFNGNLNGEEQRASPCRLAGTFCKDGQKKRRERESEREKKVIPLCCLDVPLKNRAGDYFGVMSKKN